MWARIDKGIVAEIIDSDPSGRFHPSLTWVECSPDTAIGMTYTSGVFGAIPTPNDSEAAEAVRAERDKRLREIYDVGIIRAGREERMGSDVSQMIAVLDAYATDLLNIPQQEGFPHAINWPETPVDPTA